MVAGVCSGASEWSGIDVASVRLGFLVLTVAGGVGLVLYGIGWLILPLRSPDESDPPLPTTDPVERLAALAVIVGAMVIARSVGIWFTDMIAVIGITVSVGIALVWGQADSLAELGGRRPVRIAVGIILVVAGMVAVVVSSDDLTSTSRMVGAAMMASVGVAFLFGAQLARLSDERDREQRARIREEERSAIAAHLHDGVLQTLALIQKSVDDPAHVGQLARRQERELRQWLHGDVTAPNGRLASTLADEIAGVEAEYEIPIEVVCVGDAGLDEGTLALIGAVREAAVNASSHSGAPKADVFVEVDHSEIHAFVRDRGCGFDVDHRPNGRRGIRDSMIGRMERAGGSCEIRTSPGEGTEVRFHLPRSSDNQDTT